MDSSLRDGLPEALTALKGVGPAVAERLHRLGVERPVDLLFLLPQRYEDRTRVVPLGGLRPGMNVVVEGEVALADVVIRRRRSLLVRITDRTGHLTLRFFHFSRAQQAGLAPGVRVRCFGEVRPGAGSLEMVHPEYRLLSAAEPLPLEDRLTPVYPAVEGLSQFRLRDLTGQVLARHLGGVRDWLRELCGPALGDLQLPPLEESLRLVHRPPPGADLAALAAGLHPAQRRLALEEMLAHHLALRSVRERNRQDAAWPLPGDPALKARFLDGLGFALTKGQATALADIEADLARASPMMRLVQGDVGCGKTVVAAAAALAAVAAGHQVAVMAPTELLAEQHRESFRRWFQPLGIVVAWLSGSMSRRARESTYGAVADGTAQVIVGTHALFQAGLEYHSLALVIVDEQHRFGVHQRLRLMEKGLGEKDLGEKDLVEKGAGEKGLAGKAATGSAAGEKHANDRRPHQLVMTATPIPRTLAMTLYADLDTSVIRELPPGRQPVTTVALPDRRRPEVVARVLEACRAGARAYWVCPLIEESEHLPSQAAETTAAALAEALPELKVGLIHGRMGGPEKERAMKAFAAGKTHVLVATTVIEVGVDVPEATLMIIENAERLGLSQLHQLRGRVGRGREGSTCVLLYQSPLSALGRERLEVLRTTSDGFLVAQRDLELRGPGEVLGTRQTGMMQFKVADLIRDADLAGAVQGIGQQLLREAPAVADTLRLRWIGTGSRYGEV